MNFLVFFLFSYFSSFLLFILSIIALKFFDLKPIKIYYILPTYVIFQSILAKCPQTCEIEANYTPEVSLW